MKRILFAALLACACPPGLANAQVSSPEASALSACVTRSVNREDSVTTMRWLFIAMSRHPDLPQSARVGDSEGMEANRRMGALFNRLIFETCPSEAQAAFRALGQEGALDAAFGALGEKAMTDLMANQDVLASVVQLGAYIDSERFNALAAPR